jgi:glycosyltransferase involved in cell wall biosynthesis
MILVFSSYIKSPEFSDPVRWLNRIGGYIGILESLAEMHTVMSVERIDYCGEYSQRGVQYHFIKQKRRVNWFPFAQHRLIKQMKPDVVFVNGLIFPWQTILLRLQVGRKTKIVGLHHAEKPFRGIKKFLQRLADKCFDAYCFSAAEFGSQWAAAGNISGTNKVHEIMEVSSDIAPVEKQSALAITKVSGAPVYLWVGRLNANKDPLTVIKAFILFARNNRLAKLYMIFQTEELLDEINVLLNLAGEARSQVILQGAVLHSDLGAWYSSADFIVSGSHYEGSGTAVCEAMSCGCIPLLTDIESFRMMTGRGNCGWLYAPGNPDALAAVFQKSEACDLTVEREKVICQYQETLSFHAIASKMNRLINALVKVNG